MISWLLFDRDYNDFVKALLLGDMDARNEYMNDVAERIRSYGFAFRGKEVLIGEGMQLQKQR